MTKVKERAFELIKNIPDEDVISVISYVQNLQHDKTIAGQKESDKKRREAFEGFMQLKKELKKPIPADFDYKKELLEALDEKYGCAH